MTSFHTCGSIVTLRLLKRGHARTTAKVCDVLLSNIYERYNSVPDGVEPIMTIATYASSVCSPQ